MAEIATHPYNKWQKSRPIPIPEFENCDPSERHLRTMHFLGVKSPGVNIHRWQKKTAMEWKMLVLWTQVMFQGSSYNAYTLQLHRQVTLWKPLSETIPMPIICSLIQYTFNEAYYRLHCVNLKDMTWIWQIRL